MTICVFVGPTLRPSEIEVVAPGTICLPPVAQGDLYRVACRRPKVIGIVDGYFGGAPAVWHKEILWALAEGIHVLGSASLGALRAAELHAFGMHGVGRIFEAYRDGVLEDDDEVAVAHGPAELGYVTTSEPMVNIRATLAAAEAEGVLGSAARRQIEDIAKRLFFPRRNWPAIVAAATDSEVQEAELAALRRWLPEGRVDQKRRDALEMLQVMNEVALKAGPPRVAFRFEWTHFWDELAARPGAALTPGLEGRGLPDDSAIEELRLEGPAAYERVRTKALLRMLAGLEARRQGATVAPDALRATASRWRSALGLFTRTELDNWLEQNRLDAASLELLLEEEARLQAVEGLSGQSLHAHLLTELRLTGAYGRLVERAQHKEAVAAAADRDNPDAASGPAATPLSLRLWFCEERLRQAMPDDPAAFARSLGFSNVTELDTALRHEWRYLQLK